MSKRAVRRHHYKRRKAHVVRNHYWGHWDDNWPWTKAAIGICANHPNRCRFYCLCKYSDLPAGIGNLRKLVSTDDQLNNY